jgi:hypothetical protein
MFVSILSRDVNERGRWGRLNNERFDVAPGNGLEDERRSSVPSGRRALGAYNVCVSGWFNDDVEELNVSSFSNNDEWCWWVDDSIGFLGLIIKDVSGDWTVDSSWISSAWKVGGVVTSLVVSFGVDVVGIDDMIGNIRDGLDYKIYRRNFYR